MQCRVHHLTLIESESRFGPVLVCPDLTCSEAAKLYKPMPAADIAHIAHIAQAGGMRPEPPKPAISSRSDDTLEKTLVARITHVLEQNGYEVLHVGQYRANGAGTSIGYPDLSVRRNYPADRAWPLAVCVLLEAKTETGRLSAEQKKLNEAGWSVVVRSAEQALLAVKAIDRRITI